MSGANTGGPAKRARHSTHQQDRTNKPQQQQQQQQQQQKQQQQQQRQRQQQRDSQTTQNAAPAGGFAFPARTVRVMDFAQARASELNALLMASRQGASAALSSNQAQSSANPSAGANAGGGRRAFQLLPRHRRRRAASHNVYRVPPIGGMRRFAQVQMRQQADVERLTSLNPQHGKAKRRKAASKYSPVVHITSSGKRKVRRKFGKTRPAYLRMMYRLRQRNGLWFETHVWHAKRCHMRSLFGVKVAWTPTDKTRGGLRSVHKTLSRHCMIQDVSYEHHVIELSASSQNTVAEACRRYLHPRNTTSRPDCTPYTDGTRMGHTVWYDSDLVAIGPVRFLWRPHGGSTSLNESEESAAGANEPLNAVLWLFVHAAIFDRVRTSLKSDVDARAVTASAEGVQVASYPHAVSVFRLRGPRASHVVWRALRKGVRASDECGIDDCAASARQDTVSFLETLLLRPGASAAVPTDSVCSLVCHDPRHSFPPKKPRRSRIIRKAHAEEFVLAPTSSHIGDTGGVVKLRKIWPDKHSRFENDCSLWDSRTRKALTEARFNERRRNPVLLQQFKQRVARGRVKRDADFPEEVGPNLAATMQTTRIPPRTAQHIPLLLVAGTCGGANSTYGVGVDVIVPSGWGMPFWMQLVYAGATRVIGQRQLQYIDFERCIAGDSNSTFPFGWIDTPSGQSWHESQARERTLEWNRRPPSKRINYEAKDLPPLFANPQDLLHRQTALQAMYGGRQDPFLINWKALFAADTSDCNLKKIVVLRGPRSAMQQTIAGCSLVPEQRAANVLVPMWPNIDANILVPIRIIMRTRGVAQSGSGLFLASSRRELAGKGDSMPIASGQERQLVGFVTYGSLSRPNGVSAGLGFITLSSAQALFKKAGSTTLIERAQVLVRAPEQRGYRVAFVSVCYPRLY